jgi:TrmH family RNA methyltransferase
VSHSIRIVLIETSHPGNIGAAARALKNMALDELVLVRPRYFPHPEATARASGADDLLARARVVDDLASAVRDCGLVLATTAREREQNFRVMDARAAAQRLVQEAAHQSVAVVFGAERSGLSNEELNCAHALLRIPANPAYAALNLAMAVQIVSYEILCARGSAAGMDAPGAAAPRAVPLATPEDMEHLYAHLAQVLEQIEFHDRTQRGTHLMNRIRRFLQRAELDANEANILRGILTAVQQQRRQAGERA